MLMKITFTLCIFIEFYLFKVENTLGCRYMRVFVDFISVVACTIPNRWPRVIIRIYEWIYFTLFIINESSR